MGGLLLRRRAMMQTAAGEPGPVFPVTISAPMTLSKICLNGSITYKNDWRSSGYIAVPTGATKVRWTNSASGGTGFRAGKPDTDTQTSGITMIASGAIIVANGATSSKYSVVGANYVYISRNGTNQSAITVEFLNE